MKSNNLLKQEILQALVGGDIDLIQKYYSHSDFLKLLDSNGNNPLQIAAMNGKNNLVTLIQSNKSNNINAQNDDLNTALHLAILNAHYDTAILLLESNLDIDVKVKNCNKFTALDLFKQIMLGYDDEKKLLSILTCRDYEQVDNVNDFDLHRHMIYGDLAYVQKYIRVKSRELDSNSYEGKILYAISLFYEKKSQFLYSPSRLDLVIFETLLNEINDINKLNFIGVNDYHKGEQKLVYYTFLLRRIFLDERDYGQVCATLMDWFKLILSKYDTSALFLLRSDLESNPDLIIKSRKNPSQDYINFKQECVSLFCSAIEEEFSMRPDSIAASAAMQQRNNPHSYFSKNKLPRDISELVDEYVKERPKSKK